jgi:hypothetical protein
VGFDDDRRNGWSALAVFVPGWVLDDRSLAGKSSKSTGLGSDRFAAGFDGFTWLSRVSNTLGGLRAVDGTERPTEIESDPHRFWSNWDTPIADPANADIVARISLPMPCALPFDETAGP